MSGHGKREAILKSDATSWRDRVYADMAISLGRIIHRDGDLFG
jgi:hypothetical protein